MTMIDQQFAKNVRLLPLSLPAFARSIALLSRDDFDVATKSALAHLLREIMTREVVEPAVAAYPWLAGRLSIDQ